MVIVASRVMNLLPGPGGKAGLPKETLGRILT